MATPVPLCTHVKPSGATCGSPAVSGTALCYHHSTVKTTLARVVPLDQEPYGAHSPIPFVFPEDRASLQIDLFLLLKAFNEKRIDQRTATIMHRMLRSMSSNLGAKSLNEGQAEATTAPTSAPSTAPVADPVQPTRSGNTPGNVSASHEQPAPRSTSEARKPAPVNASDMVTNTAANPVTRPASNTPPHPPLPPTSQGPIEPIDPSSAFSTVYTPSKTPAYPPNSNDRKSMGALSAEGQRILAMFSSQPD
jgi:hypothetical protein